ncbi:MAG: hypothetical protein ACRC6M_06585, partial [Microcystaceae cyanobacterium]
PANSKPLTETEIQTIDEEGFALAIQLQKELSPDYEVVYFSEKSRQIIPLAIAFNLKKGIGKSY